MPVHPVPVAHLVLAAHRAPVEHRVLAAHRAPVVVLAPLHHVRAKLAQAHRAMVNAAQVLRSMANVRRVRVLVVRVAMAMPLAGVQVLEPAVRVVRAMLRATANPTASAVSEGLTANVRRVRVLAVRVVRELVRVARAMLRAGVQVLEPVRRVVMVMPRVDLVNVVNASHTVSAVSASLTAIVRRVRVLAVRVVRELVR
ncbi:MAG: hypothetical protein ACKOA5_13500, partial [Actinomycetota bacterium]